MASTIPLSIFFAFLLFISPSIAKTSIKPRALILPVTKDAATRQYITAIRQRTPLVPLKLTIDVGGRFVWVDCEKGYVSSSIKSVLCDSTPCNLSGSGMCSGNCTGSSVPEPGCICSHLPYNPITRTSTGGDLKEDVISLQSLNRGSTIGPFVSAPNVVFDCGATFLLEGLAKGLKGIAGLGNNYVGLPTQLANAFNIPRKFAICLSSSTSSPGVIFFGHGPYVFLPGIDLSKKLIYTPLLKNPVSTAGSSFSSESSTEYFIGVKSIKVNGKFVPINSTLLNIHKDGQGGTKISTVNPYTVLETSIYKAVTKAFVNSLSKIPTVKKVAPFEVCYKRTSLTSTRVGPGVPNIEFVLRGKNNGTSSWIISGANSMVAVNNEVLCLGFVGEENPTTSIVIGGHQIENNLLQFDIANKRLGFSNSLLFLQTTCANFNFKSKA